MKKNTKSEIIVSKNILKYSLKFNKCFDTLNIKKYKQVKKLIYVDHELKLIIVTHVNKLENLLNEYVFYLDILQHTIENIDLYKVAIDTTCEHEYFFKYLNYCHELEMYNTDTLRFIDTNLLVNFDTNQYVIHSNFNTFDDVINNFTSLQYNEHYHTNFTFVFYDTNTQFLYHFCKSSEYDNFFKTCNIDLQEILHKFKKHLFSIYAHNKNN